MKQLPALRVYRGEVLPGGAPHLSCAVSVGPRGTGPSPGFIELRRGVERCATCVVPEDVLHMNTANQDGMPLDAAAVMAALPLSMLAVLSQTGERIATDLFGI